MFKKTIHQSLRPDFTSKLEHGLAFRTPKFYIAPYDTINHRLVNLNNYDVKSGPNVFSFENYNTFKKSYNIVNWWCGIMLHRVWLIQLACNTIYT